MSRKVIVTVAPTGGMGTKQDNPNLPTQPLEIAETVARCCELGASVAAIHARRPQDDRATCNPEIYTEINALVRERCDIVINNSTGGGVSGDVILGDRAVGMEVLDFEHRLGGADAAPEMAAADTWTDVISFGGAELLMDTPPSKCERLVRHLQERGVKPDLEATDAQRRQLRAKRLDQAGPNGYEKVDLENGAAQPHGAHLDDNITVLPDGAGYRVACRHCGQELKRSEDGDGGSFSDLRLARIEGPPALAGPHVCADSALYVDAEVVFRQLCCPGCATAFLTGVVPASHPLPGDELRIG
jgi:hypothetical protein